MVFRLVVKPVMATDQGTGGSPTSHEQRVGGDNAFDPRARPRMVAPLARLLLRLFFRDIEVVGAENIPKQGGLMYAANHVNALVDPALLMATMPRSPRFLGKSTLWRMAILRPFLRLAAAIPVYRKQDPGVDPARNAEMFAQCHEVLRVGGTIAIFPEGTSHNEPALVPLKTGISRIVLEAESGFEGLGIRIVPVGLMFEDKATFRSRALVKVGQPIDPSPELHGYRDAPRDAVQSLTNRVREGLHDVTLNYPSWREARRIERAAELFTRPDAELPEALSLEQRFTARQAFIEGYRTLRGKEPERVAAVANGVAHYDELLTHYGLRDAQVASRYPPHRVWRFVTKSVGLLAFRLPLALIGSILNGLPYWGADTVARRKRGNPDVVATYKLFAGLIFYPVMWVVWAGLAGWYGGWRLVLLTAVLAPVAGYIALRFHERRGHFRREARAFLLLHSGRRSMAALRARRAEVLAAVQALAKAYQTSETTSQ